MDAKRPPVKVPHRCAAGVRASRDHGWPSPPSQPSDEVETSSVAKEVAGVRITATIVMRQ